MDALLLLAQAADRVETDFSAAWIATFATFMTMVILGLSVLLAGRQIKEAKNQLDEAKKTRHAQTVASINREWRDIVQKPDSLALLRKYTSDALVALVTKICARDATRREQRDWDQLLDIIAVFESIGVLAAQEAIPYDLAYDMWGGGIHDTWESWKEGVKEYRQRKGQPDAFMYFEKLGKEVDLRLADRLAQAA